MILGPVPEQRRKVADVACHENPLLVSRQLQNVRVRKTVELPVLVQGQNVVTAFAKMLGDDAAGDMRVQQQARGRYSPRAAVSMNG